MPTVLVVDDSAVARRLISHIIDAEPDLQVVGHAHNGAEALALVRELRPDVVTMDIRMPIMDGYQATATLMASTPTPIIMVSAHEPAEIARSFRAIDAGATMVLRKPIGLGSDDASAIARELVESIRSVSGLRLVTRTERMRHPAPAEPMAAPVPPVHRGRVEIVAIAASTGGPAAVGAIMRLLPADFPVPVVLVQHIAEGFDAGFATYIDSLAALEVRLAQNGERPAAGVVYIAPNGSHLTLAAGRSIRLVDDGPIGGHRPSATPMFASIAAVYGGAGLGVILTGIGRDGCDGLADLHRRGGRIVAQDEESSVVYGMPRAAVDAGLAHQILPVGEIADAILQACARGRRAA